MQTNAYILDWTMNYYDVLKEKLNDQRFAFEQEKETRHIRVSVPFNRIREFSSIIQSHLSTPYNYVDIQFPDQKETVVIFIENVFHIYDTDTNEGVKQWAIEKGLPPEQANWGCSF